MQELVRWFEDIRPSQHFLYGSKAVNLGLIAQKSVTPPGFCLATNTYFDSLKAANVYEEIVRLAEEVQRESIENITIVALEIYDIIMNIEISSDIEEALRHNYDLLKGEKEVFNVAVRSSATAEDLPSASFAGQLESYLDVANFSELLECVKKCWASLWTPRAIHYRNQKGIGQQNTGMAVIIQEMIPAQIAGVMFTANPLTNSRKEIYIEAIKGLGEALVQGEISGDKYIVAKENYFITHKEVVEGEQFLTDFNIKWLANEGMKFEYLFFDECQDIEWAYYKGQIYLLQTRPITTLNDEDPEALKVDKMTTIQRDIWTNVNERFPEPVLPIDSIIAKLFYLSLFEAYGQLGFTVPIVNWSSVEEGDFPDFFVPPAIVANLSRIFKLRKFLDEDIQESWKYNENAFNKYLHFLKEDTIKDFPMEIIIEYIEDALKDFQRANTFRYFLYIQYGTWYNILARILTLLFGNEGKKLQQDLIAGQPQITMELNEKLVELAGYANKDAKIKKIVENSDVEVIEEALQSVTDGKIMLTKFHEFIEKYGDRELTQGLGGIAAATWRDNPNVVWGMLNGILIADVNSVVVHEEILKRRQRAEERLGELISHGVAKFLPIKGFITRLIGYARKYTAFREDSHFYLTQVMPIFREMFLQIGKKLVKRSILENEHDVMYFTYWELKNLVFQIYNHKKVSKLELMEKLTAKKQRLERRQAKWRARDIDVEDTEGVLRGIGSSSGKVTGVCKIILDPRDFAKLKPGDILVAQYTNPSWTPVFSFIGGLIVEYGSAVSHSAIIAREYGIPAVMGVPGVTKILKDNDIITMDGTLGLVKKEEG